jgi:hypothetical protein
VQLRPPVERADNHLTRTKRGYPLGLCFRRRSQFLGSLLSKDRINRMYRPPLLWREPLGYPLMMLSYTPHELRLFARLGFCLALRLSFGCPLLASEKLLIAGLTLRGPFRFLLSFSDNSLRIAPNHVLLPFPGGLHGFRPARIAENRALGNALPFSGFDCLLSCSLLGRCFRRRSQLKGLLLSGVRLCRACAVLALT